jgi:hypothetical protein
MRGSGNAPELDAVGIAACEEIVRVDLVRPAEEVLLNVVDRRTENRKP